jgi:hypothetical protein
MIANGRNGAMSWFAVLGAALVVSCGAGSGGGGDEGLLAGERGQEIALEVKNLNFYDAELYALMGTARVRLGFVNGNSSQDFSFRWPPQSDLRIEIHLLAVGTYFSDRLPVEEGDELELIIEPDLHRQTPSRRR